MEAFEMLILTRSLERIAATFLGGGAIYMAYRIFINLPDIDGVSDNFRFRQYLSFHIIKIGIGAVFMMFGALIILFSFFRAPTLQNFNNEMAYSGFGNASPASKQEASLLEPEPFADYFMVLNTLPDDLKADLPERRYRGVALSLSRVKLNLMLAVWNESLWGDPVTFKNWVFDGEHLPPPQQVNVDAVHFFNQKD